MYKCAIYVIYDKEAILDRYVGYFIRQLKTCVQDVYVVINCECVKSGLQYLDGVTDIFYRKNLGYDVEAFKDAIFKFIGIDRIKSYDELLMVNDSFYGPFIEFKDIFTKMDKVICDFWGASKHGEYIEGSYKIEEHLQSFFLCVRKKILKSKHFFRYWADMPIIRNYNDAIRCHETLFTKYFVNKGYKYSCLADMEANDSDNTKYNYCQYAYIQYELIKKRNFPFLKRRPIALEYKDMQSQENWKKALNYIDRYTNYDVDMIYENLIRTQNHVDLFEKLCLQYVLQGKSKENALLDKAVIVVYVKYKSAVGLVLDYLDRIKDEINVVLITSEKSIYEIYLKNNYKIYMQKEVHVYTCVQSYEYICIIQDDDLSDNANFSCVKKSAFYGIWENLISSIEYIIDICNIFEKNKWLGVLTVPDLIHAEYFGQTWNNWIEIRENVSDMIVDNNINSYFSVDSIPVVKTYNMWLRRTVFEKLLQYKSNNKSWNSYMISYIAQSIGLLSGVCETAEYAAMNQINQQSYLNMLVKQEYRQGDRINTFTDVQKAITLYKVKEFKKKYSNVYVYGMGKMAREYRNIIEGCCGYVISDGMTKTDEKQLYLSQLTPNKTIGIIICMNEANQRSVIPGLKQKGFDYLCI